MATLFNTKIKDTYQSLLKLEDNTILTTTVKNVTDGLGNASPLYMSTTRIGIGTNAPAVAFEVRSLNQTDVIRFKSQYAQYGYLWTGNTQVGLGSSSFGDGAGTHIVLNNIGAWIGAAGGDMATAKLHIKGSGSTSATTALLVQNSAGTAALQIYDDLLVDSQTGKLNFANGSTTHRLGLFTFNAGVLTNLAGQLTIQGGSNVAFGNNQLNFTLNTNLIVSAFVPSNDTRSGLTFSSDFTNGGAGGTSTGNVMRFNNALNTAIGNVTLNHLSVTNTINTTAGTTLQRGFYYNPTLTSTVGFTHNAIETVTGNVLLGTTSGNVGIGTSSPTEKLDVVGNIKSLGTLNISIPSINTLANGSIIAAPSGHGRPYAVDFTIGAYTLGTNDNQLHFGTRNSGVFFTGSQMYTYGIPTQIWGTSTGPNNCSSLHIGVNSTSEYQTGTAYPSTADNYFYLSTVIVAPNGSIYSPTRPTPTRRKFIFSASELIFHTGDAGVEVGRIFSNGNWAINTTTNAGYKLDINGSTRVKANSLTISASGLSSPPANYVALNFDDAPNHHEKWFAINSKKDLYGAIGTGYDRIIFPTMGNDDSTWEFNALGSYSRILISARNSTTGNYLSLTNSSINFTGPWTVVSIDRTNRKLVFGNMSTDVHHIEVYDLVIKGAQPFESNAGGSVANGGNVYVVGGTPSTSPAGNYGNVILAHDGTSARGSAVVGGTTPAASAIVDVQSTTKGVLFPRMTNAQRGLIASPAIGLLVYCTDATEGLYIYKSTGWTFIA